MKNLIEKIHELKDYENYDYDQAITDVEILLDQYNIITAPKSIKLSEIVSRLNECDKRNKFKKIIKTYETTVVENTEFKKEYIYISKNKIFDLSEYMFRDYYKWLYTLWIAGTEIVDDLECEE